MTAGQQDFSMAPTPSASQVTTSQSSNSPGSLVPAPRRTTRKSTLTQQQKNQKRQRATSDQLILLEIEFEKNPTPTAVVRDRIAKDINMTERSVQIWFQNRRAKIKNIVKKSIENGEDTNDIPESMRRYLAMQAMETGKPLGRDFAMPRFGAGTTGLAAFDSSPSKVGKSQLSSLTDRVLSNECSDTSFHMSIFDGWYMATYWSKFNGSRCLLFTRQRNHHLLHQ